MSNEIRARDLDRNQYFREEGMDDIHRADSIDERGDSVLIDCYNGCEITLDGDTVVEVHDSSPITIAGQITLANGRSVHFQITDVAGDINYSQWGQDETTLYSTVPLLDGLVAKIKEDELLVVPHG